MLCVLFCNECFDHLNLAVVMHLLPFHTFHPRYGDKSLNMTLDVS